MTIPHSVRIAGLVLGTTIFYGYVGQLVPQKEVAAPVETVMKTDMTTADMVKVGREIMDGKGLCLTCHTIGKSGALRFPDLAGIGGRAGWRRTVAGTSVRDRIATSKADTPRMGHASGQTTRVAVWTNPAPSTAARSRSSRHDFPHVAVAAAKAIQPKRPTYAIITIAGPL